MATKKMLKEIAAYCRNNIEDFEIRVQLALKKMDRMRCPLSMADEALFKLDPVRYMMEIKKAVKYLRFFRWHVGGDIKDPAYLV